MVVLTGIKNGLGIKIRKKLTASSAYGVRGYGAFHYGAGADVHGIYRVRHRWNKIVQEKMPFYFPTNNQLPAQQAWRGIFADGVAAWNALTDEQKEVYNKKARYKNYYGCSIFMREYLLSN